METEKIPMGQKQLQRWHLIKMVEGRKITLREAGEKMSVSYRQAKRIRRVLKEKGQNDKILCIVILREYFRPGSNANGMEEMHEDLDETSHKGYQIYEIGLKEKS